MGEDGGNGLPFWLQISSLETTTCIITIFWVWAKEIIDCEHCYHCWRFGGVGRDQSSANTHKTLLPTTHFAQWNIRLTFNKNQFANTFLEESFWN